MSFYLTLPSTASKDTFPENRTNNWRTKLAETIRLPGKWEVALTELTYDHSWTELHNAVFNIFDVENLNRPIRSVPLAAKQYETLSPLLDAININLRLRLNSQNSRLAVVKHVTTKSIFSKLWIRINSSLDNTTRESFGTIYTVFDIL